MTFRIRWVAVAAALAACTQANAAAVMFTGINSSATLVFSTTQDGATLLATVKFTLQSWSANQAVFNTLVTNSSSGPGSNSLMSFGIDVVSPALSGATTNSSMWDASIMDTLPSFQKVDLCVWAGNGCSGGSVNDGLGEGGSASFLLTLTTAGNFTQGITFTSPYGIKFQDVGLGGQSYEFAGCIQGTAGCGGDGGGGGGGSGGQVPEPDVLALLGIATLAYGLSRRIGVRPLLRVAR
ncbi:PEP-CTERM protein-sorting domain-containing protein [Roseateles sp. YR242]|uniref:cistern family PEP-CTERM protein n=1 Tax=Roseateles sp. YR242 TaxID=1855305 RepID=UPI0008C77A95|nr:cistern family PEP-CTERM protein [Roseateles sp. YR242]SEK22876.1 PEP-CTERM protein-sorting domain-containing protein [Roseateles sp. YR242]